MKLLIDENLPVSVVQLARHHKIESCWVREESPAALDIDILDRLRSTGETLVTRDIRFANHVLEQIASGAPLGGVVLIREQRMADVLDSWRRWLRNARTPRGIVVLTTRGMRYREHPEARPED